MGMKYIRKGPFHVDAFLNGECVALIMRESLEGSWCPAIITKNGVDIDFADGVLQSDGSYFLAEH